MCVTTVEHWYFARTSYSWHWLRIFIRRFTWQPQYRNTNGVGIIWVCKPLAYPMAYDHSASYNTYNTMHRKVQDNVVFQWYGIAAEFRNPVSNEPSAPPIAVFLAIRWYVCSMILNVDRPWHSHRRKPTETNGALCAKYSICSTPLHIWNTLTYGTCTRYIYEVKFRHICCHRLFRNFSGTWYLVLRVV